MIRVVVDENIPICSQFRLPEIEIQQVAGRNLSAEDLRDADALLVRSVTKVNQDLLEGTPVKFVASATAGIDHLDTEYLRKSGIPYFYAAGSNAQPVVDYVLCSLAAIKLDPRGRRVGILGCGQVGGRLYRRLQALGVKSRCYDPLLGDQPQFSLGSLEDALDSEIICLHTPLTTTGPYPTKNMLGYDQLMRLPKGAVLINAGRGGVVNEEDLKRVLSLRSDIRLICDVWSGEPSIDADLVAACEIATPHIAGYSVGGKSRGSQMVFDALFRYFDLGCQSIPADSLGPKTLLNKEWASALLEVYDPRRDDANLRGVLKDKGIGFDSLRKNYPKRAEIDEFLSTNPELGAFGFKY